MQQDELRERMERLAPTFACWDLLEFAAMARPAAVSLEQMARQIGRSPDDTRPALDHLVACGVFREADQDQGRYRFDPPADVTADIKALIGALAEGSGRLWAVTAVLQLDLRSGAADAESPTITL
jgi:hypothetical protein